MVIAVTLECAVTALVVIAIATEVHYEFAKNEVAGIRGDAKMVQIRTLMEVKSDVKGSNLESIVVIRKASDG